MKELIVAKLRVNVKSLAEEARIIRKEFNRTKLQALDSHRRCRVRQEARYAQLALAFVRGCKYRSVEANARQLPDEMTLIGKLKRTGYAATDLAVAVVAWLSM